MKRIKWCVLALLVVLVPLLGAWVPEGPFDPGARMWLPPRRLVPVRVVVRLIRQVTPQPVNKPTPTSAHVPSSGFPIIGAHPAPICDCAPCGVCTGGGLGFEPELYWYIRRAASGETEDGYVLEVKCVCPAYREDTGGKPVCYITIHKNGNIFINRGRGNYGPLPGYMPTGSVPGWPDE